MSPRRSTSTSTTKHTKSTKTRVCPGGLGDRGGQSSFQLDQDFPVALLPHVDRRLDAAARQIVGLAELNRPLDVAAPRPAGVRLELSGDAVAGELHQYVVAIVPVGRRPFARR